MRSVEKPLRKFLLLTLALLLLGWGFRVDAQISNLVQNQAWYSGSYGSGTIAYTSSDRYGDDIELWVIFDSEVGCDAYMVYAQASATLQNTLGEGPIPLTFHVRVDKLPLWAIRDGQATGFYLRDGAGVPTIYGIGLPVKNKLIIELAKGANVRFLRVDNGFTDRFSLRGSYASLSRAYNLCQRNARGTGDPDLRYFEVPPASQQRPRAAPPPSDPDRGYFR